MYVFIVLWPYLACREITFATLLLVLNKLKSKNSDPPVLVSYLIYFFRKDVTNFTIELSHHGRVITTGAIVFFFEVTNTYGTFYWPIKWVCFIYTFSSELFFTVWNS